MTSFRFTLLLPALAATLCSAAGFPACSTPHTDSLYFFYQRTIYLENLFQEGAWWANPTRISTLDKTTVLATNTGLLGGKYSLSSVRVMFRIKPELNAGFGVTGAGTTEGRSFTGTQEGAHFTSKFTFNRPSLETAVSYTPPFGGRIGALLVTGTESIQVNHDDYDRKIFFFFGVNPGYSTPLLFDFLRLSFSAFSLCHMQVEAWWDNCAKAGVQVMLYDEAVLASLEYGFSLDEGISFFRNRSHFYSYEVVKGVISIRYRRIAGLLAGFSKDTRNLYDNGPTLHGGVELRRSDTYPFFGGYETGVSFFPSRNNALSILHRFWIGYCLKKTASGTS